MCTDREINEQTDVSLGGDTMDNSTVTRRTYAAPTLERRGRLSEVTAEPLSGGGGGGDSKQ